MASIMLNHQFSWTNPTCSMVSPWFLHGFSMIKTGQSPPFLVIPGHPRRRHRRLVGAGAAAVRGGAALQGGAALGAEAFAQEAVHGLLRPEKNRRGESVVNDF